jgi:beta-glucanase (GH16 family)
VKRALLMGSSKANTTNPTGSYLTLATQRDSKSAQLAGELDFTAANITYASIRVLARVSGDAGAVAGLFTYHDDDSESDIELLTRDPTSKVHYSNQPTTDDSGNTIAGSTYNDSISTTGDYTTWNVYRLDWFDGTSVWYVNGVKDATTTVNVPASESMFILNMWSNNGSWSGSMAEGGSAKMEVQWIEMAFNTSAANTTATANPVVCSIEKSLGTPVVSRGSAVLKSCGTLWTWTSYFWIALVLAISAQ